MARRARPWPHGVPSACSCPTTPTSKRSKPTCRAWRWSRCSSRSGSTAAPTARPACCARRYRFAGEMRATGEVLVDMLPLLQRTGFDAVQLRADQSVEAAGARWRFFPGHYQGDVVRAPPLFAREGSRSERRRSFTHARAPSFEARLAHTTRGAGRPRPSTSRPHRAGHQPGRRRHGDHRPDRAPPPADRDRHARDRHAARRDAGADPGASSSATA